MSHPGNDEIIDNERDSKIELSQNLVHEMTKFGIGIVQHMSAEILQKKPGLSLKEFTKILDDFLEKQKDLVNKTTSE
tara:strand:+ start:41 stop:271 length:231 start_codon:yes stop_codon:yes gene_type:complete